MMLISKFLHVELKPSLLID